jgi:thiol-disulfide isomerase/thioredoxin
MRATAVLVLLALVMAAPLTVTASSPSPSTSPGSLVITYFYGDGCPYCAAEVEYLERLTERFPAVVVDAHEVWYDEGNRELYLAVARQHGIEPSGVPGTFVAGRAWIGFSPQIAAEIESAVIDALAVGAKPQPGLPDPTAGPPAQPPRGGQPVDEQPAAVIELPLVSPLDLGGHSLVAATGLIALVDGFNPCSLWVLSILLAIMLHSGSRRRVSLVGGTFLLVTAGAYGLFMVGLFGVMGIVGYLFWIQALVAAVVLVFALIAIKDYFWVGRGISLSIPERHKPRIYAGSRSLLDPTRPLSAVLAATVVLAAGVALVELPCTAGLPLLWSSLMAQHAVAAFEFGLLLGLYLAVYLLDEAVLFGGVLLTMRATRMQEHHGRVLKLVAGCLMLVLAATMLLAPTALNSLSGTLAVFVAAMAGAAVVLIAHRRLLPRLGIQIGNEA